ncbi:hypothetical protein [Corallococcus llansteffanensis]|uniref:Uncharacterized protein n=1 Tax=Corallococcus llansteffanensis TaxID=2316731 RepID=A0A3A8PYM6_9BACT|nr:hypothetical protein [Corallococcus llansteffanensis]RKH61453.1 hypothetical protein D7V93_11675 [Corallococcus llansteffanensis]
MKPWGQEAAKLEFKSMHGAQKAEEKVRAEALQRALGVICSTVALDPFAAVAVASVPWMPRGVKSPRGCRGR